MFYRSENNIDALIAKGRFDAAAKELRRRLDREPRDTQLRQQLGDVLGRAGRPSQAISVLAPLVHEYARMGLSTKAIAVVKKIQRLDPARADTDQLISKVQIQAQRPPNALPLSTVDSDIDNYEMSDRREEASRLPAYHETFSVVPDSQPKEEPASDPTIPVATSKLDDNWLEKVAARSNFRWSPILSHLSSHDLSRVIGRVSLLTKHAGSIIYGQGDPADSLFILATGFARAFDRIAGDPYRQTAVFEEGQFFGEEAFFAPAEGRKVTVTAARDCELLELDLPTLHSILQEQHGVLDRLESVYRGRPWTRYEMAM